MIKFFCPNCLKETLDSRYNQLLSHGITLRCNLCQREFLLGIKSAQQERAADAMNDFREAAKRVVDEIIEKRRR